MLNTTRTEKVIVTQPYCAVNAGDIVGRLGEVEGQGLFSSFLNIPQVVVKQ